MWPMIGWPRSAPADISADATSRCRCKTRFSVEIEELHHVFGGAGHLGCDSLGQLRQQESVNER
eukprot:767159-Hanusia_phi.AAC.2